MPASFKVRSVALDDNNFEEVLDPDFGESAIGRVAPVDSGMHAFPLVIIPMPTKLFYFLLLCSSFWFYSFRPTNMSF